MAIPTEAIIEVRPTVGDDLNGAFFTYGASGTDFSMQNSPALSNTDLVIDAVDNTKVSSAGSPIGATHPGNGMQISAGSGFTPGFYRIVSQAAGVAVLDRACGTVGSTGGTFRVGGALNTIKKALTFNVAGNHIWVKRTGYDVVTSSITLNNSITPSATTPVNKLRGYDSFRGDDGMGQIQGSTSTNWVILEGNGVTGWLIESLEVDGNSLSLSYCIRTNQYTRVRNCRTHHFGAYGIICSGYTTVTDCEIDHGVSGAAAGYSNTGNSFAGFFRNFVHDNQCIGALVSINANVAWNIIVRNTGASSDGIQTSNEQYGMGIHHNIIWANGRDGIRCSNIYLALSSEWTGNIIGMNGAWGFNGATSAGTPAEAFYDGNFYYNNTSGNRRNMDDTSTNVVNGSYPYLNPFDVILGADPFVDSSTDDWRLDPTNGADVIAAARSIFKGLGVIGYLDGGPLQHQDTGGGGGGGVARLIGGSLIN